MLSIVGYNPTKTFLIYVCQADAHGTYTDQPISSNAPRVIIAILCGTL